MSAEMCTLDRGCVLDLFRGSGGNQRKQADSELTAEELCLDILPTHS